MSYCPVCHSTGDAPCRSPSGRAKNAPHSARVRRTQNRRAFSQAVKREATGLCQVQRWDICSQAQHPGEHAHHVLPRGRGGHDDPANGLWVCWEAHDWIHAHPAEALARGLLRSAMLGGKSIEETPPP